MVGWDISILVQFTTTNAMKSLEAVEKKLGDLDRLVEKLQTWFNNLWKSKVLEWVRAETHKSANAMERLSKNTKEVSDNLKDLNWKWVSQLSSSMDKLEATSRKLWWMNFWEKMASGFSKVWAEIVRNTKLLTAFSTVAWWVIAYKAKNEYLEYSKNIVWLQNVTNANTPESQKILNEMVANIASRTWVVWSETIANIIDTASWGITVNLGWADAKMNAKAFEEIQTKIWLFWKSFWTDAKDVNNAVVKLWASIWLSAEQLNKPQEIDRLLWYLAIALKNWVGSLSEYTTAIPKFAWISTLSWKTPEEKNKLIQEALAKFTMTTLTKSPSLSWFQTKAFEDDLQNMLRQSKAGSTKISNILKPKTDSEWRQIKFSFLWDAQKTQKVKDFLQPFENADYYRKTLFLNEQWAQWTPLEVAANISKMVKEWEAKTWVNQSELLSLFTTNTNTKQALIWFINQEKEINKLIESFKDLDEAQNYVNQSTKNYTNSFAYAYSKVSADFNNLTNDIWNKLSPSLNSVSAILSEMMTWWGTDMAKFNKTFQENYETLKDSNPMLAKMVSLMKDFWNYVWTWKAKEDFDALVSWALKLIDAMIGFKNVVSSVWNSWPVKWLRDILWGWAIVDVAVAIWGYSAFKVALWAAVSWAFSLIWNTLVWLFTMAGTMAWTAAWKAMTTSFSSLSLAGKVQFAFATVWWATIWVTIWEAMYNGWKKLTDKDKKEQERIESAVKVWDIGATLWETWKWYNQLTGTRKKEFIDTLWEQANKQYDLSELVWKLYSLNPRDYDKNRKRLEKWPISLNELSDLIWKENVYSFLSSWKAERVASYPMTVPNWMPWIWWSKLDAWLFSMTWVSPSTHTALENLLNTYTEQAKISAKLKDEATLQGSNNIVNKLDGVIWAINNIDTWASIVWFVKGVINWSVNRSPSWNAQVMWPIQRK